MKRFLIYVFGIVSIIAISSCGKETEFFSDPYEEGKPALGIVFDRTLKPNPEIGTPGGQVVFKIKGLAQFKDKAIFNFNGESAEILNVTDEEVTVKVPDFASTGNTSIYIDDIIVYGPKFTVQGKVKIDPTWQGFYGTNGSMIDLISTPDEKHIFVGNFTDYERKGQVKPINRLVRTFSNGAYDASWRQGEGANGGINDIIQIQNHYYIAGGFSGYDQRKDHISNLTRIFLTGKIDTMGIKPFRRPDQTDTLKYYPTFNGGFENAVGNIYEHNGKIIATGNFRYYIKRIFGKPNFMETKDSVILDSTEIRQVARLNLDGTLDKTYRFNGNTPFQGGNGRVNSFMHESGPLKGKLVVYGTFNRFDNQAVGYILRLNENGTIDPTFNPSGVGANHYVNSVTYNDVTGKYVLNGSFTSYNGVASNKMVLLNSDGTVDNNFKVKSFGVGYPDYSKQLDDGIIIVSGWFVEYNGVARKQFLIMDAKGDLMPGMNSIGSINGTFRKVIETKSEDGKRALILMGDFNRIDDISIQNIVRVIIE